MGLPLVRVSCVKTKWSRLFSFAFWPLLAWLCPRNQNLGRTDLHLGMDRAHPFPATWLVIELLEVKMLPTLSNGKFLSGHVQLDIVIFAVELSLMRPPSCPLLIVLIKVKAWLVTLSWPVLLAVVAHLDRPLPLPMVFGMLICRIKATTMTLSSWS